MAVHRRWICDDAFISYRYAQNMLDGKGLVFNEGEYVEGYSNFLWTIFCAAGMALGISVENWSIIWGIAFFALSLALLAWHSHFLKKTIGSAAGLVPIAVVLAAAHEDWTIYATSGLETSAYVFFLILGYVMLVQWGLNPNTPSMRAKPAMGLMLGLVFLCASLIRPDGVLFALIAGALLPTLPRLRWKVLAGYALAFGMPYAAFMIWRKWYYGDWLPNTYYAKSASLSWWEQGLWYLRSYFMKYGALLTALPALAIVLARSARAGRDPNARLLGRMALIAAAFAIPYMLYVTRVGGDFMYARSLIPATPFFIFLIEIGLAAVPWPGARWRAVLVAALVAGLMIPSYPMNDFDLFHGIANEWKYYAEVHPLIDESQDQEAMLLKKYCAGLPLRMVFLGAEAHAMFRAKIPVAIEAETGLTDRYIAHQSLARRARVGHEKNAPLSYLTGIREAHLTISREAPTTLKLTPAILERPIMMDGTIGWVLTWDAPIMEELKRRGVRFLNLPREIDRVISLLPQMTDKQVRDIYERLQHNYFDHVSDAHRENRFLARLGFLPKS